MLPDATLRDVVNQPSEGVKHMVSKLLASVVAAGILLSATAPVTFAADAPKTKAECEKMKGTWDAATKKCTTK